MQPAVIIGLMIVAAGLFLLIRGLIEPYLLENAEQALAFPGEEGRPALTVSLFSDLHAGLCKVSDDKLIRALFSSPCDALLFGGDVCNDGRDNAAGLLRLAKIASRAAELQIPCYAVRGNHDTSVSRDDFLAAGFTLLENENVKLAGQTGLTFLLLGLDDSGRHKTRVWPTVSDAFLDEFPVSRRIALVHNSDYIFTENTNKYRFQLSGHSHGGQIYMPFGLEFRLFRKDRLALEGIHRGSFYKYGICGYISRGCGCVVIPIRLFSKPQITHITFRSK